MSTLRDPRQHDELLNYRLKRLVSLGGAPAIRLCEGRYGVARSEWRLIAALVESGPMTPSELVHRAGMPAPRASLAVRALVGKGLVRREPLSGDRRRAVLSATDRAYALYSQLFPQLARINRRLVAVLDDDEVEVLDRCLLKLAQRAQQIYDEGGGVDARAQRRLGNAHQSRETPGFSAPRAADAAVPEASSFGPGALPPNVADPRTQRSSSG